MVLNATFDNISVISWRSVLLVEKTFVLSQVTDTLYHKLVKPVYKGHSIKPKKLPFKCRSEIYALFIKGEMRLAFILIRYMEVSFKAGLTEID
jgi:hypothetical protein